MIKNVILFAFILFVSIQVLFTPTSLKAADITVGATSWLNQMRWDGYKAKTALTWGPCASIGLTEKFSLSGTYLFSTHKIDKIIYEQELYDGMNVKYDKAKKQDVDLTLNYNIHNAIKLYLGAKYLRLNFPNYSYYKDNSNSDEIKCELKHRAYGIGLGVSNTFLLGNNFYLLCNVGGIFLKGTEKHGAMHPEVKVINATNPEIITQNTAGCHGNRH